MPPLDTFIGQPHIIRPLRREIEACLKCHHQLPHMILYGAPGLGKDELVNHLCRAMQSIRVTVLGSYICQQAARFDWLEPFSLFPRSGLDRYGRVEHPSMIRSHVLFVNECEVVPTAVWEVLHSTMQKDADGVRPYGTDFFVPPYTLILATNYAEVLKKRAWSVYDRCPWHHHFKLYNEEDLARIVTNHSRGEGVPIEPLAALGIAQRSRGIPRHAKNGFWPRINHERQLRGHDTILPIHVDIVMAAENIAFDGLTQTDIEYLETLQRMGGKAGKETLAHALQLPSVAYMEQEVEPWLKHKQLIGVGAGGRILLPAGQRRLRLTPGDFTDTTSQPRSRHHGQTDRLKAIDYAQMAGE